MTLPDFLIVGAPKAGTTALHVGLAEHPQLFMSAVKEPKFFMTDGAPPTLEGPGADHSRATYVWRRDDYEALFAGAPAGARCGESTALYLFDRSAHRRAHDLVPDARLIAVLRDPIDRAHSNWMHLRSVGLETERDFLVACSREEERQREGWGPLWAYLGLGRYGEQLQDLYRCFPPEQVLVLRYEDLCDDPGRTVAEVCAFLGVDAGAVTSVPTVNVTADAPDSVVNEALRRVMRKGTSIAYKLPGRVPETIGRVLGTPTLRLLHRQQRTRHPMTREERCALIPALSSDIAVVEQLTGWSLDHWRDPDHSPARPSLGDEQRVGATFDSIDRPSSPAHPRSDEQEPAR